MPFEMILLKFYYDLCLIVKKGEANKWDKKR